MENSESTLKESHGTIGDVPEETGVSTLGIRIGVIGTNFKIAQISAREQLARKITLEKLLRLRLDEMEGGPTEIVLLSTCNRIEVYYASEEMEKTADILSAYFVLPQSAKRIEENFGTYEYSDGRAIEHLFEVAAGLDSLVIGEAQILAQVREASKLANERGLCGPLLAKLFSKAYDAGREIRESYPRFTNGFRNSVSLTVSDLISTHFEKKKPNILLVGSGKMIRLATGAFDHSRLGKVIVAARRQGLNELRADEVVPLSDISRTILEQNIEVILTATSSEDYVLNPQDIEPFARQVKDKELLILDISVPRNVNPEISGLFSNVTLLNLDDLKERIPSAGDEESFPGDKASDLEAIRASIAIRRHEFMSWLRESFEITPLMVAVRRKAEQIRSEELENALSRLSGLSPEEKEVVVKMSERIIRRFLHGPASNLRSLIRSEGDEKSKQYANLLKELFSFDSLGTSQENLTKKNSTEKE